MIADLEIEDTDAARESAQAEQSATNLAAAKNNLLFSNMPSYVNTEMGKVLPKDILSKQGVRVIDHSAGQLCDLLKRYATVVEEI